MGGPRRFLLLMGALGLAGCGSSSAPGASSIPEGLWGSITVGMDVTATGATLEFCCASGTITPPLVVDASGNFNLQGTYSVLGQLAGPAHYSGTVNGTSLTLVVDAPPRAPASYVLTFGRQPTAFCACPFIPAPQ